MVILSGFWMVILSLAIASKRLESNSCFGVGQILMKYVLSQAVGSSRMHEFSTTMLLKCMKKISNVGSRNLEKSNGITKISSKREDY